MAQKLVVITRNSKGTPDLLPGQSVLLYCASAGEAQRMFEALTSSAYRFAPGGSDCFWIERLCGSTALVWNMAKRQALGDKRKDGSAFRIPTLDSMQNFCYGIRYAESQGKKRARMEKAIKEFPAINERMK